MRRYFLFIIFGFMTRRLKCDVLYKQLETINRLLKKQSRPRNKRGGFRRDKETMDDVAPPPSLAGTRANSNSNHSSKRGSRKATNDEEAEEEDAADEEEADVQQEEVLEMKVPTMYRWISTSRVPVMQDDNDRSKGTGERKEMRITFSVPISVLPPSVPTGAVVELAKSVPLARPERCAAPGCGKPFKYRLVKDWAKGACGIVCLKTLEAGV
jgi:Ino eighty subunit 2